MQRYSLLLVAQMGMYITGLFTLQGARKSLVRNRVKRRSLTGAFFLSIVLFFLSLSRLAAQDGGGHLREPMPANVNEVHLEMAPGTPTPIVLPVTRIPSPMPTVIASPTIELARATVNPLREGALATLEAIGIGATIHTNNTDSDFLFSAIVPTHFVSPTRTIDPAQTPTGAETIQVVSLVTGNESMVVGVGEIGYVRNRAVSEAGRDAGVLLGFSACALTVLLLLVSRNLQRREYSKFGVAPTPTLIPEVPNAAIHDRYVTVEPATVPAGRGARLMLLAYVGILVITHYWTKRRP